MQGGEALIQKKIECLKESETDATKGEKEEPVQRREKRKMED
jgi:hypothetical protein